MQKLIDLTDKRFGRYLVIRRDGKLKWVCVCDCGKQKSVYGCSLRRGGTKSCGCLNAELSSLRVKPKAEANPNWKGGRWVNEEGYVMVLKRNRPKGAVSRYEKEHRVVMSESLGRPLLATEQVHHKNGVRDDNRIENLELKVSPHGAKISVTDAVSWAKETLALYCPEALKPVPYEYPSEECVWH